MSTYFDNVSVLVRYNPIANLSKYVYLPRLKQFNLDTKIDTKNNPPNIHIYPTPVIYTGSDSQYKNLGQKHFKAVELAINKNNIQFDVIHAHFTWSSGYVGAKLKEKHNVPFVVTAHGYDIYDLPFKDNEWRSKIEYVLNSADAIITVSNSNLECIKKLDVNTPVTVLPNGYIEDVFYPNDLYESRRSLGLPSNKKIILSVGSLEEVKGHKYLIESMGHVVKRRQHVICFIVGEGTLKSKLNYQILLAGLQDYVKLVGGKSHSEIPLWMNACDIFVLPSIKESFGVVQIEAMACGKPVVATRNGGSEEIITSEDYGFLVDSADPNALAETILTALEIEWDNKKIMSYSDQFKWEFVARKILKIYEQLGLVTK